jgi:hypothetical protein
MGEYQFRRWRGAGLGGGFIAMEVNTWDWLGVIFDFEFLLHLVIIDRQVLKGILPNIIVTSFDASVRYQSIIIPSA